MCIRLYAPFKSTLVKIVAWLILSHVVVCTLLSYPSIGLGREVEGRLVLAGEECQGVRRGLVECGGGDT